MQINEHNDYLHIFAGTRALRAMVASAKQNPKTKMERPLKP